MFSIIDGQQFTYNCGSWFVTPLVCVELFNVCFRRVWKNCGIKNEWAFLAVYMILGIAGIQLANQGYIHYFYLLLVRVLFFLPCFAFGRIYRVCLEKHDKLSNLSYFLILFCVQAAMLFQYGYTGYTVASGNDFVHGPIVPYISAVLGIAFWLRIAKILTPSLRSSRVLLSVADNTYSIMMHHLMGFMVLKAAFALLYRYTIFCRGFNMMEFKSNIYYMYYPGNLGQFALFYGIAGIGFSLLVKCGCDGLIKVVKNRVTALTQNNRKHGDSK